MRTQDLNLLMIFDAIMTEGAITRAADRLAMTQPAVSNALSRMRSAWGDELFVKDGRGIQPTSFARNLWTQIQGPLSQLETAVNPTVFDPATSQRTFRIAATDTLVKMIWGPLRQIIEREAPGINIFAIPNPNSDSEKILTDAEAELSVCKYTAPNSVIRSEFLFEPKYVVVMRPGHPLAKERLTLEEFVNAQHLLVSITGDTTGPTDQVLNNLGLSRRIAMTVNDFHNVPPLLEQSDLICVAPSLVVEHDIFAGRLAVFETPVEIMPTPVSLLWHKRQDVDQGLQWLRRHVVRIIHERCAQHEARLSQCCRKGYCPETVKSMKARQSDKQCEGGLTVTPKPVKSVGSPSKATMSK
ncbi:LysR family transcriptional regulator [Alteromonas sp. RKMC-009]|uniref:LysR family transcriptional regulator n=1 Tax=Alteromonas sp. RKMC-009 TaxID=2267264 RepID=UPI000E6A0E50|nr:LysR family transcriptional regulator [Alteromonas sp. RKMC-009]AYA65295.1 LysR family transcriptional regulator [Alteromonas sp. RKMC-009]MEC7691932.1 LysR family transcriptional regulator [Pseudomonadota bacterium]